MRARVKKNTQPKILRPYGTQDDKKNPVQDDNRAGTAAFMTIPEVQSFLGIKSRKTILKYITTGKLCAYKIGGTRWRIASADVMAFLKNQFMAIAADDNEGSVIPARFRQEPPAKNFAIDSGVRA